MSFSRIFCFSNALALVACLLVAVAVYWRVLGIGFIQDDWLVLLHALNDPGRPRIPLSFWRPWEDLVAFASVHTGVAWYKGAGLLGLALTTLLSARISRSIWANGAAAWVTALFVLLAPMNTITVGQVDTWGQIYSSLAGLGLLHLMLNADSRPEQNAAWNPRLMLATIALIVFGFFSKETMLGMAAVPCGLWLLTRTVPMSRTLIGPMRADIALAAGGTIVTLLALRILVIPEAIDNSFDPKYGVKNAFDWLTYAAMILGGNLVPVPTSVVFGRTADIGALEILGFAVGGLLALAIAGLIWKSTVNEDQPARRHRLLLILAFGAAAPIPAAIYHASETYAFQALPILAILAGGLLGAAQPKSQRLASVVILMVALPLTLRAVDTNGRVLQKNYGYSEFLRCELGLAPGCGPEKTIGSSSCMIDRDAWLQYRGSPSREYSLYYGPIASYYDLKTFPLEPNDPRTGIAACKIGHGGK